MKQIILLAFLLISHFTMARRPAVEPIFVLGEEKKLDHIEKSIPIKSKTNHENSKETPIHYLLLLGLFLPFGVWYGVMNTLKDDDKVDTKKDEDINYPKAS